MRIRLLWLLGPVAVSATSAHTEVLEPDSSYIESIAFEEVLPEEPGAWALRLSAALERPAGEEDTFVVPKLQAFFGITERLGAEIEAPLVMRFGPDDDVGLGDVGAGAKFVIVKQSGRVPAVVGLLEVHAPSGDADRMLGAGSTEIEGAIGIVLALPSVVLQGTFGYATTVSGSEARLVDNVSVAVRLTRRFYGLAEVLVETELPSGELRVATGPGVKYAVTSEMFVAACIVLGVADETSHRAIVQVQHGF